MSSSIISNRLSTIFSPEVLQAASAAVQQIQTSVVPQLISLGTENRRTMPRMGDKNEAFVVKVLAYAISNPEFLPAFVDVGEFQKDVDVIEALRPLRRALGLIVDLLDDTLALAGSEALMAALPYYKAVKAAAKLGHPGAQTIADDLAARFAAQGRTARSAAKAAARAAAEKAEAAKSDSPAENKD